MTEFRYWMAIYQLDPKKSTPWVKSIRSIQHQQGISTILTNDRFEQQTPFQTYGVNGYNWISSFSKIDRCKTWDFESILRGFHIQPLRPLSLHPLDPGQ